MATPTTPGPPRSRASRNVRPSSNDAIRSMCERIALYYDSRIGFTLIWARAQRTDQAASR